MNKPIFTMLIGVPGSGKTRWSKQYEDKCVLLSSDAIRGELFGSEDYVCTKEENEKVFNLMQQRTNAGLFEGKNVIYDATNLRKKNRIHLLRSIKKIDCIKQCVLLITEYDICLKQNASRERKVPEDVIWRMYTNFQPPHKSEGWDEINIVYNADFSKYDYSKVYVQTKDFDQENKNHKLSLGDHLRETTKYVCEKTMDLNLIMAATLHDIGKLKTKARLEDGECHYYQHHCVGAYDSILYVAGDILKLGNILTVDLMSDRMIEISNLVFYHMHPYMAWGHSKQAKEKDKTLLGEAMFNKIMLLHEADLAAH